MKVIMGKGLFQELNSWTFNKDGNNNSKRSKNLCRNCELWWPSGSFVQTRISIEIGCRMAIGLVFNLFEIIILSFHSDVIFMVRLLEYYLFHIAMMLKNIVFINLWGNKWSLDQDNQFEGNTEVITFFIIWWLFCTSSFISETYEFGFFKHLEILGKLWEKDWFKYSHV